MWGEAEREIERWQRDPEKRELKEQQSKLITECAEKYLTHCRVENNIANSTEKSYLKSLDHLVAFLQTKNARFLGDITAECIRDFLATRGACSPRTRRKELEHIRFFLWFCVNQGWITKNPASAQAGRNSGIRVKVPRGGTTMPLEDDEIHLLLQAADTITNNNSKWILRARLRARAMILVMCYTGFRVSDVATLKRDEIQIDGSVDHVMVKTKRVVWTKFGEEALCALLALPIESEYFFWSGPSESKLSTCTGTMRRTLYSLRDRTGVVVHPHRFRDTFAKKILEEHNDIRVLQHLLGHRSLKTTEEYYQHLGQKHKARLSEALSNLNYGKRDGTTGRLIEFPSN